MLRTGFNWEETLIQIVYSTAKLNYNVLDISRLPVSEQEDYIVNLQQKDRKIPFDLSEPCLLRLYIIKQAEEHYTIIKSEHHSITDGWSELVLLKTIHQNYFDLQQKKQVSITVDTTYLEVQNYFSKQRPEEEAYWQRKTAAIKHTNDLNPLLSHKQELNLIKPYVKRNDTLIEIEGTQYRAIKELIKREGLTLNTLVQFAWHKLIQVYTQDSQTIVGTTIAGRAIPVSGIEESVGLYINTLPLIIDWDNENTILEQIQYIHKQTTDLNNHSFVDLASLQKDGKRLFHSLYKFQNYPAPEKSLDLSEDTLNAELIDTVDETDYPIGVIAYELSDKLIIRIKSDESLLHEEDVDSILEKLKVIMNELVVSLDKKHREISIFSEEENRQIESNQKTSINSEIDNDQDYLAPKTELEIELSRVWQEVLNLEKVGVRDDFFLIGGNSVLAIKMICEVNRILSSKGIKFDVIDLIEQKCIQSLLTFSNEKKMIKGMNVKNNRRLSIKSKKSVIVSILDK
jgi:hypothetical protein